MLRITFVLVFFIAVIWANDLEKIRVVVNLHCKNYHGYLYRTRITEVSTAGNALQRGRWERNTCPNHDCRQTLYFKDDGQEVADNHYKIAVEVQHDCRQIQKEGKTLFETKLFTASGKAYDMLYVNSNARQEVKANLD